MISRSRSGAPSASTTAQNAKAATATGTSIHHDGRRGVVVLVEDPRKRRVGWIAAASAGGVASVGGAVALALDAQAFRQHNGLAPWILDNGAVNRAGTTHTIGGALLGLGAGVLASAITGLVLDRSGRFQVSTGPQIRVGGAALVVEGRF